MYQLYIVIVIVIVMVLFNPVGGGVQPNPNLV